MYGKKLSPRKEWHLTYTNDWNRNIQSTTAWRINKLYASEFMPLSLHGVSLSSFRQQSLTFSTRFSFNEKRYEDHLQRIYISNTKPVIYSTLEAGQYHISGNTGYYGKIIGEIRQNVRLNLGYWNYYIETGWIFGRVPYPFLEYSPGNEPSGISFYQFNRMKYLEFAHDKYIQLHNKFIFNGIFFNYIPVIKHFNLREMIALKAVFGGMSDRHRKVLDFPDPALFPDYLRKMNNPYLEASFGITNILSILTIQMNYRITNNHKGYAAWKFAMGLKFSF